MLKKKSICIFALAMILSLVCTVIPGISTEAAGYYNSAGAKINIIQTGQTYQYYIDHQGDFYEWIHGKINQKRRVASNVKDFCKDGSNVMKRQFLLTKDGRLYRTAYDDDMNGHYPELTIDTGVSRFITMDHMNTDALGMLAIKNDNSLWSYKRNVIFGDTSDTYSGTKIMDDVSDAVIVGFLGINNLLV